MRKIKLVSIIAIAVLVMAGIVFSTAGEAYAASDSCSLSVPPVSGTGSLNVGTTSVTQGTSISYSVSTSTSGTGGMIGGSVKLQYVEFNGQTKSSSSGSFSTSGLSGTYTITAYFILDVWKGNASYGERIGTDYASCSITIHVSVPEYRVSFDLNGGSRSGGGSLTQYVSKGDSATPPSVYRPGYSFNGWTGSYTNVTSNRTITARWVDDIGPSGTVSAVDGTGLINGYIAKDFKYTASDAGSGLSYCEYQTPGSSVWKNYASGTVIPGGSGNGVYRFRAFDRNGNVSSVVECTLLKIDSFGNEENIRDSFKVTSWYKVTLPPRIYDTQEKNISGTYTFASYDTALAFCIAKEREFRVSAVENGWIYVHITNESVSQLYSDKNLLDEAVLKYAKKYISEEQRFRLGSNNYYTPIGSDFRPDPSALNTPAMTLPAFLNNYVEYKPYMCPGDYVFQKYKYNGTVISDSVTMTYIADDYGLKTEVTVNIGFSDSIKTVLQRERKLSQGYYLITEKDIIGNVQKYIVYIDSQAPGVNVIVNAGEANERSIFFDSIYVEQYAGTFYYGSISIQSLLDNNDAYSCISISGRNLDNIYTRVQDMPILCYENDFYGKYEITVYDRSKNALKFEVVIAGNRPSWYYTSLNNQTKLTITINVNDKNNAITKLELFKINGAGEYLQLDVDDDGTAVSAVTLNYVLRTGGKYTVRVTDLFGRVTEMTPIFYKKGLPVGTLKGVSEGGITNKLVTFTYALGNIKIYRIGQNGVKTLDPGISPVYDSLAKKYTVDFPTIENTEIHYLVFLASVDDDGIFIEYEFKIDCKPPEFEIVDDKGKSIVENGSTVNAFKITWSEDVSARVALNNGVSSVYNRTLIDKDGIYTFELRDKAGNTKSFKVVLDRSVSYSLTGKYNEVDGKIYSASDLTFMVMEAFTNFNIESKKGYVIEHGRPLTEEDEYIISVTDAFGNKLTKVIVIDKTQPVYTLAGVLPNGKTNGSVKLDFEDGAVCTYRNSTTKKQGEFKSGETFSGHGKYTLTITDLAGNKVEVLFEIDIAIDFEANILDGIFTTETAKIKFLEELAAVEITKDGQPIELTREFKDTGVYMLSARDAAGNEIKLAWEIIAKRVRTFEKVLPEGLDIVKVISEDDEEIPTENNKIFLEKSGIYKIILSQRVTGDIFDFEVEVDNEKPTVKISERRSSVTIESISKKDVTTTLLCNGQKINFDLRTPLREVGTYELTVTDSLGNTNFYAFTLAYKINEWGLFVMGVGVLAVIALIIIIIKSKKIKV